MTQYKVAILHQATPPPADESGTLKPMKPGGYKDSGADIGYCLHKAGIMVITQNHPSDAIQESDWSFPDTIDGIKKAISLGANVFWTNTTLFDTHPLCTLSRDGVLRNIFIVGQIPHNVQLYDDKFSTNAKLRESSLTVAPSYLVSLDDLVKSASTMTYPLVLKPIRGRGSEGVTKVENETELQTTAQTLLQSGKYGNKLILEQYLTGQEITITVMPPGTYSINNTEVKKDDYWALPVVKRFNHLNGIAPYNGVVAVVQNSSLLSETELTEAKYAIVMEECEKAAKIVGAKAPIRIDCRELNGKFYLFDLNMKPNMTGSGRPGRDDQDSLTCIAARGIGWNFTDLLLNMLKQAWLAEEM